MQAEKLAERTKRALKMSVALKKIFPKARMALQPKKEWFNWTYRMIEYGRQVCPAHRHLCESHPLSKLYPKAASTWPRAK